MNKVIVTATIIFLLASLGIFVIRQQQPKKGGEIKEVPVTSPAEVKAMTVSSSAFANNSTIPRKYTCEGENVNPPLTFDDIPANTKSLVLIVDDPDAPAKVWSHWLVWNIPPTESEIVENSTPKGAMVGKNDFGKNNYKGPCPPPGAPHRYRFKVFALDTTLNLPDASKQKEVEGAIEDHIIGQATLIGMYGR